MHIALLLLGLALLVCLVWRTGPGDLWSQVCALGWGLLPIILIEGAANLAHTVGWRHCLSPTRPVVPLPRLFQIAMAGFAINYLTPSASVTGEAAKVALLAGNHRPCEAVGSVLLDKLTTAIAHLLLVTAGALLLLGVLPVRSWIALATTTALLAAGTGAFLVLQRQGKLGGLFRWLASRRLGGRCVREAALQVSAVDDVLVRFYREHPRRLAMSVGWHLLGHSIVIAQLWLFLFLLKYPAPLAAVAAAGFLSLWCDLLAFAVPLNLGTLEGSRILALRAAGGTAAMGMAFGIAIRLAQLSWACFGLASYSLLAVRGQTASVASYTATDLNS